MLGMKLKIVYQYEDPNHRPRPAYKLPPNRAFEPYNLSANISIPAAPVLPELRPRPPFLVTAN